MFLAVGTALQFPIPIYRNASNISRNIFVLHGAAVMSGNRREQMKMELSIFHQRRSIPFRLRLRERYSASDSLSARATSTKNGADESLESLAGRNNCGPWRRFHWPAINTLVDNILAGRID